MRNYFALIVVFCFVVFTSCHKKQEEFIYTSSSSFQEIFQLSNENKKGTILLVGGQSCNICDGLLTDVNDDEAFKNEISKQYIVGRINSDTKDAQWIYQLLERTAYPVFLFFDKDQHLEGYIAGYKNKEEFRLILNEIETGKTDVVSTINVKSLLYPSTKQDVLKAFGEVFDAQLLTMNNGTPHSNEIIKLLNNSLGIYPSAFTRSLLAEAYNNQGDSINCKQYAQQALDSCYAHPDKLSLLTMRERLHKLINKNFTYRDEAFFEENKDKCKVGEIEQGKEKKIIIPFDNGGKKELRLIDVNGDCSSCTKITYPKEIIAPGAKGEIVVLLTPQEKGSFMRTLVVLSTAINSPHYITIEGTAN